MPKQGEREKKKKGTLPKWYQNNNIKTSVKWASEKGATQSY